MTRQAAVKFRRKVYVAGPAGFHADAIDKAFSGMSNFSKHRVYERVESGKENIVFGYANEDGSDWVEATMQPARKRMYGFT